MKPALAWRQSERRISLVEVLAVAIIIGLLAAIAIPLYIDQQKKGHDADAKSAVTTVSSAIDSYVAENEALPSVIVSGGTVLLEGNSVATLAEGVVLGSLIGTGADDWCIDATHPDGDRAKVKGYKFTAAEDKVEEGRCG